MPIRSLVVVGASLVIALAGGIALGTGVLAGAEPEPAAADRPAPRATPEDTAARKVADAYRGSLGTTPVAGRLTGKSVVVVTLPGVPKSSVDAVGAALRAAGGSVVGTVALTDRLLDPADRQFASGIAQQALKGVPDTEAKGLANYELVATALGRGLSATQTSPPDAHAQTIVSAFVEGDLLVSDPMPTHRAQLAVIVAGSSEAFSSGRGELLTTLAAGLDTAGTGTLVAGPVGSGVRGGAVEAVRDGVAADSVSTVDIVGVPFGDVATVLALQREAAGTVGHFGTAGADGGPLPPVA
ncbi:copper transporter [Mumia sp. ZJ1417]|uniref:copper transporter n=1 Tax=Mumia sp. ZJ1417 TaxID=2708082 RepID=UPI0014242858|nr:copper transporter [Mumia sp. ZJ1417]QMW68034.1 copper transporter [Mumia sp. ZJ1417]